MNAIKTETDVVTQAGRSGLTARARNWVAAALVSFAAAGVTILTGGVAGAVVTDPTGGATTTLTDETDSEESPALAAALLRGVS